MRARVLGALGIAALAILCLMLTSAVAVLALRSPDVSTLHTTTASLLDADYAAEGRTTAPLTTDLIDTARDDESPDASSTTARRVEVIPAPGDEQPASESTPDANDSDEDGDGTPRTPGPTVSATPTAESDDGTPSARRTSEPTPPGADGSPTAAASTPTQPPLESPTSEASATAEATKEATATEPAKPTETRDATNRRTPTPEPTEPVKTPGAAPTATPTKTKTGTPTIAPATPIPVFTNTPTPTATSTRTPTPTATTAFTSTPTPTATATHTPTPTATTAAPATPTPTLQPGTLSIDPPAQTVSGPAVFADVLVTDALNLVSYEFSLDWDPAVLNLVGVTNGPFLGSTGNTISCQPVSSGSGTLTFTCSAVLPLLGPTGSGRLATVEFAAVDDGVTDLDLHDSVLTTLLIVQQPSSEIDGSVTVGTPQTETYDAMSSDTYVDQDDPNASFGGDDELVIEGESGKVARALVDFDWDPALAGKTIVSAEITMCVVNTSGGSAGSTHQLRRVSSGWDGLTTWATQPSVYPAVSDSATVPGDDVCLTFDVTDDMQALADGSPCFGWRLSHANEGGGSGSETRYASSEYGTASLRPTLTVTYLP